MKKINKLLKPICLFISVVVIGYAFISLDNSRSLISYEEHKSDVVATVDGEELTFEDLSFYILYEERIIEEEARIYNPDSTKDYWNMHTNDTFIQDEAKKAVIGMAIHDELFYTLACQEGMDTLSSEEKKQLEYAKTDFWEDLLDVQWTKLPTTEETINDQMTKAAIAEKYQNYLAKEKGPTAAAYKFDGYYYALIMDEHDININEKLWDRFVVGDITLVHDKVNFINGLTDEEKEKK